ncbi:PIG-L family deacetylase, partial [Actinoallomurus acaciae]
MSVAEDPGGIGSLLVVGAHAFDAEVIAGPLAAAVAGAGGRATLVHLSLGEQGHTRLAPAEYAEQKRAEAAA